MFRCLSNASNLFSTAYYNHFGHYEVALIEYDPKKTSFEVLVNYAYRNMDPFDSRGQFCDKGYSYLPAIFYETEEELEIAEQVLADIVDIKGWDLEDIAAPILPRPKFWIAEDYHQDYYLKNPERYGYYKNGCGRPKRLKELWGLEEYNCYHEERNKCFIDFMSGNYTFADDDFEGLPTVINAYGEVVVAETNIKGAGAETAARLSPWGPYVIALATLAVVVVGIVVVRKKCHNNKDEPEKGN